MIAVHQTISNYINLKCGEVFYKTPADFNVVCCECSTNVILEKFAEHFQLHFKLDEDEINLGDNLATSELIKDVVTNSSVDPIEIPIKEEEEEKAAVDAEIPKVEEVTTKKPVKTKVGRKSKIKTKNQILKVAEDATKKATENATDDFKEEEHESDGFDDNSLFPNNWPSDEKVDDKITAADKEKDQTDVQKQHKCHICERVFSSNSNLKKHRKHIHNTCEEPVRQGHNCDLCDKKCRSAPELEKHIILAHGELKCKTCGMSFTNIRNLLRHKVRHTGIKSFKCIDCSREFFTNKELKRHEMYHTGSMPHICEVCGKKFPDASVLRSHMLRHTGERSAKCSLCDKSFFSIYDLNIHAAVHTNEKPFKCDMCNKAFQRKKGLYDHKLIHKLENRKYKCTICGKGFVKSSRLKVHIRKIHDVANNPITPLAMKITEPEINQTAPSSILQAEFMV